MTDRQRCIVLGGSGTVGMQVGIEAADRGMQVIATSRVGNNGYCRFDALQQSVLDAVPDANAGDVIFVLCAQTNPNTVQANAEEIRKLNVEATLSICRALQQRRAKIIFLSTEFVFDGASGGYTENDTPSPTTMYGYFKIEAEREILAENNDALIVRTGAVISPRAGENCLVEKTWKTLRADWPRIAQDNLLTLTPLEDVAANIFKLIELDARGLWHIVYNPPIWRIELADWIIAASRYGADMQYATCKLNDIPYPEVRPPKSWLDGSAASKRFDLQFSDLREAVGAKVRLLEEMEARS